jgi:hypothetical protein
MATPRLILPYGRRDFANGFLVAEILSKYFPQDIQMHSFENVTSQELKMANWRVLEKFFRVRNTLPPPFPPGPSAMADRSD